MKNDIYRKTALDRLSSPDELDQLITIIKPKSWIALIGIIFILFTVIVWAFVGSIPVKIYGEGMIITGEGVDNVIHNASGKISDVSVRAGDYVSKGDVIARVDQDKLVDDINSFKKDIQLAQKFDVNTFLLKELELSSSLSDLYDIALKIKKMDLKPQEKQFLIEQLETKRAVIIAELNKKLEKAVTRLNIQSRIVSQVDGRILEVNIEKGNIIKAGDPVASIIRDDETINNLEVVLYVPPEEGKKIVAGMDAHIIPTIIKKEEYGYMLGKVISVSEYPISLQSLMHVLGNQELANNFSNGSAPIEVRVHLIPNSATYSGIEWSISKGPNIKIDSGNMCKGSVIIDNKRPIEMVMPFLKQ